uniref:Uncharacterized protein n=1 Tax=Romanomermis culicivorax TaxID=13658 RepID=A0A915HHE3_ROMCU
MQPTQCYRTKGKFLFHLVRLEVTKLQLSIPTESGFSGRTFQAVGDPFRSVPSEEASVIPSMASRKIVKKGGKTSTPLHMGNRPAVSTRSLDTTLPNNRRHRPIIKPTVKVQISAASSSNTGPGTGGYYQHRYSGIAKYSHCSSSSRPSFSIFDAVQALHEVQEISPGENLAVVHHNRDRNKQSRFDDHVLVGEKGWSRNMDGRGKACSGKGDFLYLFLALVGEMEWSGNGDGREMEILPITTNILSEQTMQRT